MFTTTKFNTMSSADEKHICVREHDQKTIFRDILPLRKEICNTRSLTDTIRGQKIL